MYETEALQCNISNTEEKQNQLTLKQSKEYCYQPWKLKINLQL